MGTATLEVKLLQQVVALRDVVLHVIFLDLHKAYDALDRLRCLVILEGYCVGPRYLRLLCRNWERMKMVVQAGGHYREPFHRERGVTQGDPLFPTIFNVVVDAVVNHWKSLVAEQEGGDSSGDEGDMEQTAGRTIWERDNVQRQAEEGYQRLKVKAELFYADYGMVASTDLGWLQSAFDTLTGLFDRAGIQKNIRKTVGIVYRACRVAGVWEEEAYTRRMKGEDRSFEEQEQERERVLFQECGKELAKGSLVMHRQTQNGVDKGRLRSEVNKTNEGDKTRTYRLAFPAKAGPRPFPAEGCSGWASTQTEIKVQFWHRHIRDTVVILEEGNLLQPWCPLCDMLVPWKALNGTHRCTAQCNPCAEWKRQKLSAE